MPWPELQSFLSLLSAPALQLRDPRVSCRENCIAEHRPQDHSRESRGSPNLPCTTEKLKPGGRAENPHRDAGTCRFHVHAPAAELAGLREVGLSTSPAYTGLLPLQPWATLNRKDTSFPARSSQSSVQFPEPKAALILPLNSPTPMHGDF